MAVCQNLVPLVNIKIAGKWMFIPLKMVIIGIDPYPHIKHFMTKKLPWSPRGPEVDQLQCPVVRFLHGEHQDVTFIQVLEPRPSKGQV